MGPQSVMGYLPRRPAHRAAATDRQSRVRGRNRYRIHRLLHRDQPNDGGFVLLETLVSISLIMVVMAAFTTFFVNSVAFTSQQRATQVATQIANSTIQGIRALPASDVVTGSSADGVGTQLTTMSQATNLGHPATAPSAAVKTLETTQKVNNIDYRIDINAVKCEILTEDPICAPAKGDTGVVYIRADVAVTWNGAHCPSTGCTYVTSTLLSTADDPTFNMNQSTAVSFVDALVPNWAVGDPVNLATTKNDAPPFRVVIDSGALPPGLALNTATGVISGTPIVLVLPNPSSYSASTSSDAGCSALQGVCLRLTDSLGKVSYLGFSWTMQPALATTAPTAQANFIGSPLTMPLPAVTGGIPGYKWSDPATTLPPGLALSTVDNATITGTPTVRGVFPVTLTVTDSMGGTSTVSFSWTTDYPPMVAANPGSQTSTVSTADSLALSVTGGSGSFAWTGSEALPNGLTLSSDGVVSGAPSSAGVTSVILVVTDTKAATQQRVAFSWTVYGQPTVTSPGNQSWTVGAAVSLQLPTSCPNAPCTYVMNNGPATFGISAGGLLAGAVTDAAQTYNSVTVTVTDSSATSVTSEVFTVTVNAPPSVQNPGDQTVAPGSAVNLNVAGLTTGGTAPLTFYAKNLPPWAKIDPEAGFITGTAPDDTDPTTGTVLIVTDALGVSASSGEFSWTVDSGAAPSAPLDVAVVNGDSRVTASWTEPAAGPATSYIATLSPGDASCKSDGLSCDIGGLTNGVVYSLTVMASNDVGTGPASTPVTAIPYPAVMSEKFGMSLWLDGADPSVLLGNPDCKESGPAKLIGCWKDKSGRDENFVQKSESSQPGITAWSGLSAVNFTDPGDVLNSINDKGKYQTVFVAANITNAADEKAIVDLFGQAEKNFNVRVGSGAPRNSPNGSDWSFKTDGPLNWANGAQGAIVNQPVAVITTDQAPSPVSFTASVSNSFEKRGLVGQVGDVITFDSVLNPDQRRSVEEYLANKWGVHSSQAPTNVRARARKSDVVVSWTPPKSNGDTKISGYTVTPTPEAKGCQTSGELSCTVTGLDSKTAYTFSVTATDSNGTVGPASTASNFVTVR